MADWNIPHPEASDKHLLMEVGLWLVITAIPTLRLLEEQTVSWIAFASGILIAVLIYGASTTPVGQRVRKWTKQIGVIGVIVTIGIAIAASWGAIQLLEPQMVAILSLILGISLSLLTIAAGLLARRFNTRKQQSPA